MKASTCKQCGSPIGWKKLSSGLWCPTQPDGTDHFDHCSQRRWAHRKATGKRVEVRNRAGVLVESGYTLNGDYNRDYIGGDRPVLGAQYFRLPCADACPTPPWEDCPSCPHAALRMQLEQQVLHPTTKRSSAHGKRKQSNPAG